MAGGGFPVVTEYELAGREIRVEQISDGLGFGEGSISRLAIESAADPMLPYLMHAALTHRDLLRPISVYETGPKQGHMLEDDGCGDGRRTDLILVGGELRYRSLHRAKVFGGGLAMASASRIALGHAVDHTLNDIFISSAVLLDDRGMDYGGHTVTASREDAPAPVLEDHIHISGCGCLDKFPESAGATATHHENIAKVAGSLAAKLAGLQPQGSDGASMPDMFANFDTAATTDRAGYSGGAVIRGMLQRGKVVKALGGVHQETDVVLNYVEDYTADQGLVRDMTGQAGQIFSVDVWRIDRLARGLYDEPAQQRRAAIGMLAFTLGVSATLTKGDQRIWTVTATA